MGQNFGLAKSSYAQATGIGFTGLTPLLHAWVVFRNIVYLLFVFAFILIGLAIMMRLKIDPRTVMTIQNQIPKIIVSLVLVTFSFAIAGFLIDMMWVSTYAVINVMSQADSTGKIIATTDPKYVEAGIYHPAPQFANDLYANDALGGIHSIAFEGAKSIADITKQFIRPETLGKPVSSSGDNGGGIPIISNILNFATNTIGDIIGSAISQAISWVVGIVAYLILICALLIALLKLWFALLKAYISILVDVIFAPFWIVAGLIPGQTAAGFGPWLRDMAGNLAAFPAAILMLLLAKLLSDSFITSGSSATAFIPPLLGQNASNYIANLISIGVILATPGVVDMTKKAFKAPEFKMGAIGQSFGAGAAFIGNPTKRFGKAMFGKDERTGQAKAGSAFVGRHLGPTMQKVVGGGDLPEGQVPGSFKGALGKFPGAKAAGGAAKAAGARVAKIPYVGPVASGAAKAAGKIGGAPGKAISSFKKWAGPPPASTAPQLTAAKVEAEAKAKADAEAVEAERIKTPAPIKPIIIPSATSADVIKAREEAERRKS
jgi:hypothetical protein